MEYEDSNRKTVISQMAATTEPHILDNYDMESVCEEDHEMTISDFGKRKQHVLTSISKPLGVDLDGGETVPFSFFCECVYRACDRAHGGKLEPEEVIILKNHLHINDVEKKEDDLTVSSKDIRRFLLREMSYATPGFSAFFAQHNTVGCAVCRGAGLPLPTNFPLFPAALVKRQVVGRIVSSLLSGAKIVVLYGRIGDGKRTAAQMALQEPDVRAVCSSATLITAGERPDLLECVQQVSASLPKRGPILQSLALYRKFFEGLPSKPALIEKQLEYLGNKTELHPSAELAQRIVVVHNTRSADFLDQLREILADRFTLIVLAHKEFLPKVIGGDDFDLVKLEVRKMSSEEGFKILANTTNLDATLDRENLSRLIEVCDRSFAGLSVLSSLIDSTEEMEEMVSCIDYCSQVEVDHTFSSQRQQMMGLFHAGLAYMPKHWIAPYLDFAIFREGIKIPRCMLLLLWRRRFPEIGWERPNRLQEIIAMIHSYMSRDFFGAYPGFQHFQQHELLNDWAYSMSNQTEDTDQQLDTTQTEAYREKQRMLVRLYYKAFKAKEWSTVLDGPDTRENAHHQYMRNHIGHHLVDGGNLDKLEDECLARHALVWAVTNGATAAVRALLNNKTLMKNDNWKNALDRKHRGPLLLACMKGHSNIVTVLVNSKADVTTRSKLGETPILLASENGHAQCVKLLLDNKARPISKPTKEHELLLATINGGGKEEAKQAARQQLFFAALEAMGPQSSQLVGVPELMAFFNEIVNDKPPSEDLVRELVVGAKRGKSSDLCSFHHAFTVYRDILVKRGDSIDRVSKEICHKFLSRSSVRAASLSGHIEVLQLLLDSIKTVNLEQTTRTELMAVAELKDSLVQAARFGHMDIVTALLECQVDCNFNSGGETALINAAKYGHCEIVKSLLVHKCPVNELNGKRQSALWCALEAGHVDVTVLLLKHGATALDRLLGKRKSSTEGASPREDTRSTLQASDTSEVKLELLFAVEQGYDELVAPLLDAKAAVNKIFKLEENAAGSFTILEYVVNMGSADLAKLLLSKGADPNLLKPPQQQILKSLAGDLEQLV